MIDEDLLKFYTSLLDDDEIWFLMQLLQSPPQFDEILEELCKKREEE